MVLPLPGVEIRIVISETEEILSDGEIGDVQLRGPNVFKGYWRQPDKTSASFSADGWFKTGDLGFREKDGYITLCGRSKDLIISGGLNIYPPEVERVLGEHPAVSVCAVMSIVAGLVEEVPPPVVVKPGLNLPPTVVQIVQISRILWRPRLTLAAGWPEPITP